MLLVEQNIVASLKIAHRAYILESGRIALTGPAEDLISSPRVRDVYLGLWVFVVGDGSTALTVSPLAECRTS